MQTQTLSEFILDLVILQEQNGDACHASYIWTMCRSFRNETDDQISNVLFALVENHTLVEVGKDLYERGATVGSIMEEEEHPTARAIRERIDATEATRRGRPWTPKEFSVGHALPHQFR